jgi:FkbM family methyltransferase
MSQNFYSQLGEDAYVYKNFINTQRSDGYYIELGAMDGDRFSNTKFYHDSLQFKGILIEPTVQYHELMKNRPDDYNFNVAINHEVKDVDYLGEGAASGIQEYMNEKHKNDWCQELTPYKVKSCPINVITKLMETKYVDLFSIDVEGAELAVLETFDWSIPVYVVVIELDGNNLEKDEKCRQILINNGFEFNKKIYINEFWVNPNYFRKNLLFDATKEYEEGKFVYLEPHCSKEILSSINNTN